MSRLSFGVLNHSDRAFPCRQTPIVLTSEAALCLPPVPPVMLRYGNPRGRWVDLTSTSRPWGSGRPVYKPPDVCDAECNSSLLAHVLLQARWPLIWMPCPFSSISSHSTGCPTRSRDVPEGDHAALLEGSFRPSPRLSEVIG